MLILQSTLHHTRKITAQYAVGHSTASHSFPDLEFSQSKKSGYKVLININDHEADKWKFKTCVYHRFSF